MKSATILRLLNPVLFIAITVQFTTVLIQIVSYQTWVSEVHQWVGYSIGILIILHVYFNWNWVKATFFKKKPGVIMQSKNEKK